MRNIAVIDIGKTNAKVALFDLAEGRETHVGRMGNTVLSAPPYPHHDIEALWRFILDALTAIAATVPVDAVSISAHGASIILLDRDGELALPMLDYEHKAIEETSEAYERVRPAFAETGSPRLAAGLNVGAQLFWQQSCFPDEFAKVATIIPYPQYWGFRLTGVRATEMTSLGAHTDLWNPYAKEYSSLVDAMGWQGLMPPMTSAFDPLGPVTAAIAHRTGLAEGTPVFGGLHDSNASLLTHLKAAAQPFSVVSTGTWVICFAVGGKDIALDAGRDTLMNVNAYGDPVPSSRFMGGRAFALLEADASAVVTEADKAAVLDAQVMLLPSIPDDSGPFTGRRAAWTGPIETLSAGAKLYAVSLHLGLMTGVCLDLIGADGPIIIEGPFGANIHFLQSVAAVTGRDIGIGGTGATGTCAGAAALALGRDGRMAAPARILPMASDARLDAYVACWRKSVDSQPQRQG